MPGFEVVPRPSYQQVILCSIFGNKAVQEVFFDIWGRFGFDGQDAVTDGIPGLSDIRQLSGRTISADYDYALAA